MAAGCKGRDRDQARLRESGVHRRVGARSALLAIGGALVVAAAGVTTASAASAPNQPFARPLALPGGAGASASGITVTPGGASYIAGATSGAGGCVLFQMAHGGDTAKFLGRTAGGVGCALGVAATNGSPSLEVATTTSQGLITASTGAAKPHLHWSSPLAATTALPAIATDPAPPAGSQPDTFLIVQGADALPHVAVSSDGGATYSIGSALINATDVPADEWQGQGPLPVAGNIVARRDAAGGLVLYSVFAAADGAQDRAAQQQAKTNNLNRVYGAVGVVTPSLTPGGAPSVTWKDVLIWRASPGTALNRTLPQVGVDSSGQVYATFADGRHVYVKQDTDGLQWNAAAAPVAVDDVGSGVPLGTTANALPAIAAGGNGIVDLAWFNATGGKPHDANPAADPLSSWSVLLAQSTDSGRNWVVTPASGLLAVHQGALDPAAALQLGLDPASGAAVLAYTGDPTVPGLPSLFATRQCTGLSAVTGSALVNDCVASQPATAVLPGTSCPGPQVTDPGGDAIDTSATGTGLNAPSLDLLAAHFNTSDTGAQLATLTLNSMSATLPVDVLQAWWVLTWTQGATERYAQLTISQTSAPAYTTGLVNQDGSLAPGTSVPGAISPGANGGITFTLSQAALGNPAAGTTLSNISAATYARFVSAALSSPQLIDRAPDAGTGADYGIAQVCDPATDLPEVPAAVLIPVVGSIIGFFFYWQRRRRPRRAEP